MTTKELLTENAISRDEKIAHLKKLCLWREYRNEVMKGEVIKGDKLDLRPLNSIETLLNSKVSWRLFLFMSFAFFRTSKGYDFWAHVANYGKRPDRSRRVNKR